MGLRKKIKWLTIAGLAIVALALGGKAGVRWWGIRNMMRPAAGARTMLTMTELPRLPGVSWEYAFRNPSREEKEKLLRDILEAKLSTYPAARPPFTRAGKHRTMGFANFEPTQEEIETLATHYDVFYLNALASHRIPVIKRANPKAKVLMYFAISLTKAAKLHDAGSVDDENTAWILQNHADWLLKDRQGRLVEGKSWSAKFWADPGNEQWQAFLLALNRIEMVLPDERGV